MRDEQFFEESLFGHVRRSFGPAALDWLTTNRPRFVSWAELTDPSLTGLVIPNDVPLRHSLGETRKLSFFGTDLTTWELLAAPSPDWVPWPTATCPMFFVSSTGAMMPSWNVLPLCVDLLCRGEESRTEQRDELGRFVSDFSPRKRAGLLSVPAFNEAAAALVFAAGCISTGQNEQQVYLAMAPRAAICLSHDLDMLRGNDRWTQAVRTYRLVRPLASARRPDVAQAWWIARNTIRPYTFYHGNMLGMLELEAMFGFRSTLYFLNGSGGRFGARSGSASIQRLLGDIKVYDQVFEPGIHYNFDTTAHPAALLQQIRELSGLLGVTPTAGRAHYLRFDESRSFKEWRSAGILVDESLGYSDGVGYRCGIAGGFMPRDDGYASSPQPFMVPLAVMDSPLLECGSDPIETLEAMVRHLSVIGGTLTFLIHPGMFDNPEFPECRYLFRRVLESARRLGAGSTVAGDFVS